MEIHIYDREDGLKGPVVSVGRLFHCFISENPAADSWNWVLSPGAWGAGSWVTSLEDALQQGPIQVDTHSVLRNLDRDGERFFDAHFVSADHQVEIGVFDATFLYLKADDETARACARRFNDVRDEPPIPQMKRYLEPENLPRFDP